MYIKRQTKVRDTKNFKEVSVQIHRTNKDWMKSSDIEDLYNSVLKQNPNAKIRIRALGPIRWTTLASYDNGLMLQDDEDYWDGKDMNDPEKFSEFGIVQMTVYLPK